MFVFLIMFLTGLIMVLPFVDNWRRVDMSTRAFNVPPQQVSFQKNIIIIYISSLLDERKPQHVGTISSLYFAIRINFKCPNSPGLEKKVNFTGDKPFPPNLYVFLCLIVIGVSVIPSFPPMSNCHISPNICILHDYDC